MEASSVFRLPRTSLHQLVDAGKFTAISSLSLSDTKARFMPKMLPRTYYPSKKTNDDFRLPRGSILTLRTFYAFGARSRRTFSVQRCLSYSKTLNVGLLMPTKTSKIMQHSFTTTSIQTFEHKAAYQSRYLAPLSNTFKSTSITYQPHLSSTFCSSTSNMTDMQNSLHHDVDDGQLQHIQPAKVLEIPNMKDEVPTSKEDSAEMVALIKRNESLKIEVEQLKSMLKDKERSEKELRRKMLEYMAEVKVWKNKCEMHETMNNKFSELKSNDEDYCDIMEQLNIAAEKLTRLNAVKDLKILQSEMETALKEISKN